MNHNSNVVPVSAISGRDHEWMLINAAQSGSTAAFDELFREYWQKIYRITYRITKNHADAEDALQDTFLKAFACLGQFRRDAQFYTWLVSIAWNSSLMLLRKRRRRSESSMEVERDMESQKVCLEFRDPGLDPEQLCHQRQTSQRLLQSIHRLPQRSRASPLNNQRIPNCSGRGRPNRKIAVQNKR